jgi:hypothetical protein
MPSILAGDCSSYYFAHPYRRVNLKVFRYYIAYHIWADTIWVLAIAHGYRRPGYWMGRKEKIG